jgi:type IV fimbrial biogenesis protein FimT
MTKRHTQRISGIPASPAMGRQLGFTLIELMVVIAIVGMVAIAAGPGMVKTMERNRKSTALNDIITSLNLTRSEAITRQTTVSVCSSSDQASCNTNNWESGTLVFVDDGVGTGGVADDGNLNGTEELVRISQPFGGKITVRSRNFTDAGAITFDDDGMATQRGTMVICDSNGASQASAAVVNLSGQLRLAVDENSSGVVNDSASPSVDVVCP